VNKRQASGLAGDPLLEGRAGRRAAFLWGLAKAPSSFSCRTSCSPPLPCSPSRIPCGSFRASWWGAAGRIAVVLLGQRQPERALRAVDHVPFITQTMLDQVEKDFDAWGCWGCAKAPCRHSLQSLRRAGRPAWFLALFLIASVPARLERCCWPGWFSPRYRIPLRARIGRIRGCAFRAWLILESSITHLLDRDRQGLSAGTFSPGRYGVLILARPCPHWRPWDCAKPAASGRPWPLAAADCAWRYAYGRMCWWPGRPAAMGLRGERPKSSWKGS